MDKVKIIDEDWKYPANITITQNNPLQQTFPLRVFPQGTTSLFISRPFFMKPAREPTPALFSNTPPSPPFAPLPGRHSAPMASARAGEYRMQIGPVRRG